MFCEENQNYNLKIKNNINNIEIILKNKNNLIKIAEEFSEKNINICLYIKEYFNDINHYFNCKEIKIKIEISKIISYNFYIMALQLPLNDDNNKILDFYFECIDISIFFCNQRISLLKINQSSNEQIEDEIENLEFIKEKKNKVISSIKDFSENRKNLLTNRINELESIEETLYKELELYILNSNFTEKIFEELQNKINTYYEYLNNFIDNLPIKETKIELINFLINFNETKNKIKNLIDIMNEKSNKNPTILNIVTTYYNIITQLTYLFDVLFSSKNNFKDNLYLNNQYTNFLEFLDKIFNDYIEFLNKNFNDKKLQTEELEDFNVLIKYIKQEINNNNNKTKIFKKLKTEIEKTKIEKIEPKKQIKNNNLILIIISIISFSSLILIASRYFINDNIFHQSTIINLIKQSTPFNFYSCSIGLFFISTIIVFQYYNNFF
jgi:hypothetical protein